MRHITLSPNFLPSTTSTPPPVAHLWAHYRRSSAHLSSVVSMEAPPSFRLSGQTADGWRSEVSKKAGKKRADMDEKDKGSIPCGRGRRDPEWEEGKKKERRARRFTSCKRWKGDIKGKAEHVGRRHGSKDKTRKAQ